MAGGTHLFSLCICWEGFLPRQSDQCCATPPQRSRNRFNLMMKGPISRATTLTEALYHPGEKKGCRINLFGPCFMAPKWLRKRVDAETYGGPSNRAVRAAGCGAIQMPIISGPISNYFIDYHKAKGSGDRGHLRPEDLAREPHRGVRSGAHTGRRKKWQRNLRMGEELGHAGTDGHRRSNLVNMDVQARARTGGPPERRPP